MFLELDGHGPHYAQLTRAMKTAILDGRMAAGSRLPPTRVLAHELELSRTTVLAAYEQLRAEGFIDGRVGSGSYVTNLPIASTQSPCEAEFTSPSRYVRRARLGHDLRPTRQQYKVRYNLLSTNPLINPALVDLWSRELARAATHTALEENSAQGLFALRQQVCDYLARRRGIRASPEDVLITSGAQQAFSLTARVLLDEDDTVVMEDPDYFAAYQAFAAHGARLRLVRTDADGLVCGELPAAPPRLVCVTPSHQFPGCSVLSLSRRLELLRYAADQSCWILEDDYDGEFRYDGRPLAALRSLDDGNRVIYVGSFSKMLFSTLRLGYMVLPAALRDDFVAAKYLCDSGCPGIEQAALAHFMENGGFERHLRRVRKELMARHHALIEGLRRYVGRRVDIVDSPAGMHVVAWLNGYGHARAEELVAHARTRGLGLYPMTWYVHQPPPRAGLLLGYGRLSTTALHEAMQLFGQCLDEMDAGSDRTPRRRTAALRPADATDPAEP
ncbi:PLP-dependent aminotransferase family protein [Rhodanobacter glycinis]|uniref:MocR-like pyridoxine biosynthesis transcription factor PdxR n=1 Tax=Rhodanobacter glycinis TaxID=582702 RepID=UPI001127039B|nr:PLP-dependent aminotransferase family protein [Rhodanobacter glycinis]TPG44953.1 PLP-dependent aminotransferase family protein [Rhodanobacter glycinis]